ncbi:hypothetical protein [Mycobacterium helveticum]|nr:hypothetical protein [Mycobacterium helveticum]
MTEPAPPPHPGGRLPRDDDRPGPLLGVVAGVGIGGRWASRPMVRGAR